MPDDTPISSPVNRVTIIILTWNGLAFTRRCLETLRVHTTYANYDLIVVDNGSTDGTLDYLNQLSGITLIQNSTNLGFVQANNQGIAASSPDSDIILLNNDTEIYQSDWIDGLQASAYSSAEVGVVGCRLRRPSGMLQHAGTHMPPDYWGQQYGAGEKDVNQYNQDREVEGVVFACVYLKRSVINIVGTLDPRYFSYFEDSDYCLRAKQHGFKTLCCGSVTLLHHENVSTTINKIEHSALFEKSKKIFRRTWEPQMEAARYNRSLAWHSLVNLVSGYAISSHNFILGLERQQVRMSYRYVYGPGTVYPVVEPAQSNSHMLNLIRSRVMEPNQPQVVFAQGDVFDSNYGTYKIGYTMLETDGIPTEWVQKANQMDEVWVPSTFNVETFRTSGVTRPIHVIPLGVDTEHFNPQITGYHPENAFVFLSVFEWGERKAPDILLKAFNDEFRANEEAVLICKTLNRDPGVSVSQQVADLKLRAGGGRILFSLNEVVPYSQTAALYRSADCFVLSTRGEGWGMPILEAMACGLPVIATDWSAPHDFINPSNAYPLEVDRLIPAVSKTPYYEGFKWAQPSYEHLRELMRHVFENRQEATQKGWQAAQDVQARWTWDHAVHKIIERLDEVK